MMAARGASVPLFTLYGDPARATDAEFVHIEDIHSRSSLYGWEIESHAHRGLFQAVVVLDGGVRAQLDDRVEERVGACAIIVPPSVVHAFLFRPRTQGYVLTIAEAMLFEGAGARARPLFEGLFVEPAVIDLGGDAAAAARVAGLLDQLMQEFRWPLLGRALMFDWLVRGVLLLLERRRAASAGATRSERVRGELFARFRALVEEHYAEHWPVPRYAEALGLTERRLNRLCRTVVNRSAFEMVQDRLLLEARRRLIYIAAPVSLLAYELGFQDPAYFSRFFKKLTGVTPAAFRRRERGGLARAGTEEE